jgi:c-di-GMP-binding flagellar brake protein YcgR
MWPWNKKGGDRRGDKRRQASVQVSFRVVDAVTRQQLTSQSRARILDISDEGCGLLVPEIAPQGFNLKTCLQFPRDYLLELKLKPNNGGTWRLHGAVRWLDLHKETGQNGYRLGLRFEDPVALPSQWQRLLLAPPAPALQSETALADAPGN